MFIIKSHSTSSYSKRTNFVINLGLTSKTPNICEGLVSLALIYWETGYVCARYGGDSCHKI